MSDRGSDNDLRVVPLLGPLRSARVSPPTRQSLLRGVLFYRWATWVWVFLVYVLEVVQRNLLDLKDDVVARPVVGFLLVFAIAGVNLYLTVLYRRDPNRLIRPFPVFVEIGVATVAMLADVWVYGFPDHAQSIPSVWVVAAVLAAAIAAGQRSALATAAGLGLARYVGWLPFAPDGQGYFSLLRLSSWVLLVVAAWTAGYLLQRLEATDRSISAYRAREEVARTLHDGVLQTLAVIQRRSDDHELIDLARVQELELREYLFGTSEMDTDLASGLRAAARTAEQRHGMRVEVVTAPDLPTGDELMIRAVCGAVAEALNNASKHGRATRATIYAEPVEEELTVFVSIKDDGAGFDPDVVTEGQGMSGSIRGRIIEAGGVVEIDGRPGRGAEIRLWL